MNLKMIIKRVSEGEEAAKVMDEYIYYLEQQAKGSDSKHSNMLGRMEAHIQLYLVSIQSEKGVSPDKFHLER